MSLDVCVIQPCKKSELIYEPDDPCNREEPRYRTIPDRVLEEFKKHFGDLVVDIPDAVFDWEASGYPEFSDESYWDTHEVTWDNDKDLGSILKVFIEDSDNPIHIIPESDVKTKSAPGFYYNEISHQRRGANSKFYKDGMWDDLEKTLVFDRDTLLDHWRKYFSCGNIRDYGMTDSEWKESFRVNIINKHIDNKTFVAYW